ncbi:hypothetical protein [Legionella sp. km772]|uniref:hypothetical protein n=1 Tax=Legionella sp. km772 TaxID=2498111 RepID=UPI000F8E721C|nr:hypothetical protein [Legionella sp. km772]RUR13528.1 hypothetical protein ELY15_02170 [Legionella sp. km772]
MRFLICLYLGLLPFISYAEATLPAGCEAVAVQGDSVTLKAKKPKVVFIHNLSKSDLWLTHPVTDPSASAGWTSRIQADHWSALAVDKPSFVVSCIESKPGHEQEIPCEGAIAVCQWKGAKFPENSQGTFWAGEDLPLAELTAAIGGRGFVLPANK